MYGEVTVIVFVQILQEEDTLMGLNRKKLIIETVLKGKWGRSSEEWGAPQAMTQGFLQRKRGRNFEQREALTDVHLEISCQVKGGYHLAPDPQFMFLFSQTYHSFTFIADPRPT